MADWNEDRSFNFIKGRIGIFSTVTFPNYSLEAKSPVASITWSDGPLQIGTIDTTDPTKHIFKNALTISEAGDQLEISGDLLVKGSDIKDAGGTSRISLTEDGPLVLKEDNGTAALSIDNYGKVGIGTTSPDEMLHLKSTGNAKIILEADTDNVSESDHPQVVFKQDGGSVNGYIGYSGGTNHFRIANNYNNSDADIDFITKSQTRMTIDGNGNVGIGTDRPDEMLHLKSTGNAKIILEADTDNASESDHPQVVFKQDGGSVNGYIGYSGGTNHFQIANNFNHSDADIDFITRSQSRMTIDGSGNVGIGTPTPASNHKLDVYGDVAIQGKHALRGSDSWLRLNQDKAFTKGVHTPGLFAPMSLNVGGGGSWGNPGNGNVWISGKVGIGTADPQEKLHLNGNIRGNQSGALRISTGYGYVDIGPKNTSWSHFHTDRARYYFDKEIRVDSGLIGSYNEDLQLRMAGTTRITIKKDKGTINFTPGNLHKTHPYLSGSQFVVAWNRTGGRGETDFYQHGGAGWRSGYDFWTQRNVKGKQLQVRISDNGYLYTRRGTGSLSDMREKTNVQPITNALKKILNLRGVNFDWIDKDLHDNQHLGLIAQEVLDVVPEVVTEGINGTDEDKLLSLQYQELIPLMIEAIKEQQHNMDTLVSSRPGRDFAEFFESSNGKVIKNGTSVILENDKIRPAKKGEVPIGIISENPGVIGGAHMEWPNKYLKDEFGEVVMEEYKEEIMAPRKMKVIREQQKEQKKIEEEESTVTDIVFKKGKYLQVEKKETIKREIETPIFEEVDLYDEHGKEVIGKHSVPMMETIEEEIDEFDEDGRPILEATGKYEKYMRPKLNPDYDESKEYVPRDMRQEWNCVGLIGQLPLRKGQPVAETWIKIKDVSNKVEFWLIK